MNPTKRHQQPKPIPANHLPWIDWIRFLAAFVVMSVHARAFTLQSYGALDDDSKGPLAMAFYVVTRLGNLGVLTFFVLSGFLVGGKVLERYRSGSFSVMDYAIDRFSRIGIPFIPALLFTVAVAWLAGLGGSWTAFFSNLLFLQGVLSPAYPANEPLWSISYEVWFYIIAGAACCLPTARTKSVPFLILLAGICVFAWLEPILLLCWCLGAFAYIGRPTQSTFRGLCFALLCIAYGVISDQLMSDAQTASIQAIAKAYSAYLPPENVGKLMYCAGIGLFLQQIILRTPKCSWIKRLDAYGTTLAAFSYTLYLMHNPVLVLMTKLGVERSNRFDIHYLMRYAMVIAICCGVSFLFYYAFERNTSWFRNRLKARFKHSS